MTLQTQRSFWWTSLSHLVWNQGYWAIKNV